jgi:hypothetical protein
LVGHLLMIFVHIAGVIFPQETNTNSESCVWFQG